MKRATYLRMVFALAGIFLVSPAFAHFGMVIPSDSMVEAEDDRSVNLMLSFSHPFEGIGMELEKPQRFTVYHHGQTVDLTDQLRKSEVMQKTGWQTAYEIERPGVYAFAMTPKLYWEAAEDLFIVHYTKTYVTAFGDDTNWDRELGLPIEIVPMAKPFAQYAGNAFQGIVKLDGKPMAHAEVEVEFYNRHGDVVAPTDYFITQTVKADENGVFTYAAPAPGWWGFSALSTADYQLEKDGQQKDVEIGAVLWVEFHPWLQK